MEYVKYLKMFRVSPKDYKYKEFLASPYLVKKLFNGSNHPEYIRKIDYEN